MACRERGIVGYLSVDYVTFIHPTTVRREGGREGGKEGGREGGEEGGREGGREGRREGGREGRREGGREGGREAEGRPLCRSNAAGHHFKLQWNLTDIGGW